LRTYVMAVSSWFQFNLFALRGSHLG
jgi:hypothetical protein